MEGLKGKNKAAEVPEKPIAGKGKEYYKKLDERDMNDFPALMNRLPKDYEKNDDIQGIQSLIDDTTPLEAAQTYKENGDEVFGGGNFETAFYWYSRAIREPFDDAAMMSILLSNRAAANLKLRNFGRTRDDSSEALVHNPDNIKAHYRLGRAHFELKDYEACIAACDIALNVDDSNNAILQLRSKAQKLLESIREAEAKKRAKSNSTKEKQRALELAKEARGVKRGEDIYGFHNFYTSNTYLNAETGVLHWSVMFLYDAYNQSDFISDCPETATILDLLSTLFPLNGPGPSWDTSHDYRLGNLLVYHRDEDKESWTPVDPEEVIKDVFARKNFYTAGDFPVFHVVSNNDDIAKTFLG